MQCCLDVHPGATSEVGQCWSNAESLASFFTVTFQSGPAPSTSGVHNMVCGPPPGLDGFSRSRAHTTETSVKLSDGQRRQMSNSANRRNEHYQRQSSKRPSSAVDINHGISSQKIPPKRTNIPSNTPLLYALLTNNRKDASQSFQQSQPSSSTSANSTSVRALPSGSKPNLDDDQILCLIAKTLSRYRTEIKVLQEKQKGRCCTAKDTLNVNKPETDSVPQAMSTGTSNSVAPVKSLEDNPQEASTGCKQDSEMPVVKGTTSATAKQSKEYVQIMQDAAAICAKTEELSPVVLTALSGTTVNELATRNPRLTLNCKPSNEGYKSVWRNVKHWETDKGSSLNTNIYVMKEVNTLPESSECSQIRSAPTSSALAALNGLSVNAKKTSKEQKSSVDATVDLDSLKQKPNWQEPSKQIQTQEKMMQAGDGKIEKQFSSCVMEESGLGCGKIKNLEVPNAAPQFSTLNIFSQFEDISDDESPVLGASEHLANPEPTAVMPQDTSTFSMSYEFFNTVVSTQYEDISEEENAEQSEQVADEGNSESALLQATDEPNQCSAEMQLTCSCPYFIETEDGFEESLCPKCFDNIHPISSGVQTAIDNIKSESDDEWLVIPLIASEVKLIYTKEIDSSDEENQDPVQDSQPNVFEKIQEFDNLESFLKSKQLKPMPVEASDNPPFELNHAPPDPEAEDSCETDDSSDYPLETKPNYLTASSRLKVPSPRSQDSDNADYEVPQSSKSTRSCFLDWFPDLSSGDDDDDDDDSSRNTTNLVSDKSTSKVRPVQEQLQTGKKAKFKSHVKFSNSGTYDESNLHCNRTCERSCSLESSKQKTPLSGADIQSNKKSGNTVKKPLSLHRKFNKSRKGTNEGQPGLQKQATKRKISSTEDNCKEKVKRSRSSTGASSSNAQTMSEKNAQSPPGTPEQDSHKNNPQNVPNVKRKNYKTVSQLSPPNHSLNSEHWKQPEGKRSLVRKTFCVEGEPYEASSLPGRKQSLLVQQMSYSSKPSQVNSYSTASSTEAKKQVIRDWEDNHVPTRMERKRKKKLELVRELHSGPSYDPAPRQRHNSQETNKRLMKKTRHEAQQLTQARSRQTPSKNWHVREGYKWFEKPAARPPGGSGHQHRPHH